MAIVSDNNFKHEMANFVPTAPQDAESIAIEGRCRRYVL
jgi:hypothetical protein